MATSRLEIDLSSVERNLSVVRGVIGGGAPGGKQPGRVNVCAVVKQDGYGLGAVRLAKKLVGGGAETGGRNSGAGVDMLAVYGLDEARALAEAIANVPILLLMPVTGIDRMDPLYRHLSSGRIHLTLHSHDQLRQLTEMSGRIGATIPMHVQVDTGLSRGGAMPEWAHKLVESVVATPRTKLAGLMTHFSSPCCDAEFTREQAKLFRDFVEGVKPVLKAAVATAMGGSGKGSVVAPNDLMLHAANSCAMFRARSYHGTMVRVGQALLGFGLEEPPPTEHFEFREQASRLEPCVRWTTTVAHISEIPAGWAVGYGSAWRAPWRSDGRKTRIALVPVGYADGYPRSLGGKSTGGPGFVGFTGRAWEKRAGGEGDSIAAAIGPTVYAPVVGRVSMDQITVDVTDVPDAYLNAGGGVGRMDASGSGPEVEILGRDRAAPNFIASMAAAAGSITHEQLCRVGARVERAYHYPASAAGPTIVLTSARDAGPGASGIKRPAPQSTATASNDGRAEPRSGVAAYST